jgi:hypothetical protein
MRISSTFFIFSLIRKTNFIHYHYNISTLEHFLHEYATLTVNKDIDQLIKIMELTGKPDDSFIQRIESEDVSEDCPYSIRIVILS